MKASNSSNSEISSIPLAAELLSKKSDIFDKRSPPPKIEPFSAKEIRDEKLAKKEKKRLKKEMKEKDRKEGKHKKHKKEKLPKEERRKEKERRREERRYFF